MKKKKEKEPKMQPDGKMTDADVIETHGDFESEYLDMAEIHFKEHNPGLYAIMKRVKGGTVKNPA